MKEYTDREKALLLASGEQSLKRRCSVAADALSYYPDTGGAKKIISALGKRHISFITCDDAQYPESLDGLYEPPPVLYYKGDISLLKSNCVTIVGSRRATRYGIEAAQYFAEGLAKKGVTIVSGLARGIDTAAHKAALDCGGKTIAVTACGLDTVYPAENADLMDEIAAKGLVITEYPPGTPPLSFRFPERNRIMAAISTGVLVTEAAKGSGALITADCAVELGRELWITPGSIFSRMSEGSNELLKECGRPVTRIGDILADTGGEDDGENTAGLTDVQKRVLEVIEHEGNAHYSLISRETGITIPEIAKILMKLELDGYVKRLAGNYYTLARNRRY